MSLAIDSLNIKMTVKSNGFDFFFQILIDPSGQKGLVVGLDRTGHEFPGRTGPDIQICRTGPA